MTDALVKHLRKMDLVSIRINAMLVIVGSLGLLRLCFMEWKNREDLPALQYLGAWCLTEAPDSTPAIDSQVRHEDTRVFPSICTFGGVRPAPIR
jgi:hypothetical protein